ncbi:hypothetical protein [Gordonia soli]|nr:hypothetical protein [Gordonia soli]
MPSRWRADDYELFAVDGRVRTAEIERRIRMAVDEWFEDRGGLLTTGISDDERRRIAEWTSEQFYLEMEVWRRRHPDAPYED